MSKVKSSVSGRDSKPGLFVFQSHVFLIKMATDLGMELYGVRLESEEAGWLDDRGGGGYNVGPREMKDSNRFQDWFH